MVKNKVRLWVSLIEDEGSGSGPVLLSQATGQFQNEYSLNSKRKRSKSQRRRSKNLKEKENKGERENKRMRERQEFNNIKVRLLKK